MTLEAQTLTDRDLGEFTAVVSTSDLDRDNDVVMKGAFTGTINRWRQTTRLVPLHWNHSPEPDDIVGYVDPKLMRETDQGLLVVGRVDLDTERGKQVWRLLKRNVVAFSFGYLVSDEVKRPDGVREIRSLDLFEVSVTPSPANDQTRVLDLKAAAEARRDVIAEEEFRSMKEIYDRLDRERAEEHRQRREAAKALGLDEDLLERIAREAEISRRRLEEQRPEVEAKRQAEKAEKAARPITLATFSLE
jgi:HK97 family phage prohead protease